MGRLLSSPPHSPPFRLPRLRPPRRRPPAAQRHLHGMINFDTSSHRDRRRLATAAASPRTGAALCGARQRHVFVFTSTGAQAQVRLSR